MRNMTNNIYIHVPFCMAKCNYCAFFSRACAAPDWNGYAAEIVAEIKYWAGKIGRVRVDTVFFGGGTPSLMPAKTFATIMDALRGAFDLAADTEITAEANPATITADKLNEFIAVGLNRLSVGVQSFNDDELAFLGRRHSAADARALLDVAGRFGIRTSADFIYALPGWGTENIRRLCATINELGLTHCSLYELTIEPNTPFAKMNLQMPDNDAMTDMYTAIGEYLNPPRYEVSNYAVPGNECRHNQNVWDGDMYIGIGRGAAGRVLIGDTWYEQTGGADGVCVPMTNASRAVEKIITGMRTKRGVMLDTDTSAAINMDWVANNPNLVTRNDNRIAATDAGLLLLDNILLNLIR